ncbi:MAG: alpha/beta hydrolase-fold protein [Ignavibacteriales bacterium]|nr:alpha/beta hydrolase-fold protein [Ignavibacteriales bacterium]
MSIKRVPRLTITVGFLCILFCTDPAQAQPERSAPPQVEIRGSRLEHLTSAIVGQEYDLCVNLPRGYQDTSKAFPVMFLLDAQWDFPLLHALYGQQYYDGFIPGAIIVGITWGGVNPNHDSLRARDLTPTVVRQQSASGGAPKFLKFIKNELIPYIEQNYRAAKSGRTLIGSSFGGLFTLYALLQETALFDRYVLTSPAVGWDNEVLFSFEKEYAAKNTQLPVRLFIGIGGLEGDGVVEFQKFVAQLKSRSYKGLELETKVLEGIGHSGSKAEGYTKGLQWVFARPMLSLSREILDQYIGKYQVAPQVSIEITNDDGCLVMVVPGNTRIPLLAENKEKFFVKGIYLMVRFKKNEVGKVTGVEVEQYSGTTFAQKVN